MAATVPLPGLSPTSTCEEIATLYLRCKKAYYNGSTTLLTDAQFDDLEERLRARDPQHPYLALTGASVDGAAVVLPCWMGSLDKLYPADTGALERWRQRQHAAISKADPSAAADHACLATIKLDGVSGLIQLRRATEGAHAAETIRIFSRGNGSHGSDWTTNLEYLTSLHALVKQWHATPNKSQSSPSCSLASATIRGEFIISKRNFSKHGADYASARAMVNGLLGSKTKKPKLMALIDFIAYELVEPAHIPASSQQTILATELGCHAVHTIVSPSRMSKTRPDMTVPGNPSIALLRLRADTSAGGKQPTKTAGMDSAAAALTMDNLATLYTFWRECSPYEMDGVVIDANRPYARVSKGNPTHAFAFKMRVDDQYRDTVVTAVEWNISKHGYLIPTVTFAPILIQGVTIKRATGFHAKFIHEHAIGPGAHIRILRSGDVIPKIDAVLAAAPEGAALPDAATCTWTPSGIHLEATQKDDDPLYRAKQLTHFFKSMNIKDVSGGIAAKMVQHGLTDPVRILQLTAEELTPIVGGPKLAANIAHEMSAKRQSATPLHWLRAGNTLGRSMGTTRLQALLHHMPDLFDLQQPAERFADAEYCASVRDRIIALDGFQLKSADHILKHMPACDAYWRHVATHFPEVVVTSSNTSGDLTAFSGAGAAPPPVPAAGNDTSSPPILSNLHVLLTGTRDPHIIQSIEIQGGTIAKTWSKKVSLVIRKDAAFQSGKVKSAQEAGIGVLTVSDWDTAQAQHPTPHAFRQWLHTNYLK